MNRKARRAAHKEQRPAAATRAADQAPTSPAIDPAVVLEAHIRLGNYHLGEGQLDQAVDCYLRATGY